MHPNLKGAPCLVPGFIQQNYPNDYSPVQNCFQCFLVPRDRDRGWRGGEGEVHTRLARSPRGFVAAVPDKVCVVAGATRYNLYVIPTRFPGGKGAVYQISCQRPCHDLSCAGSSIAAAQNAKARRNYVEMEGRQLRYQTYFVSHRCDKFPGTSC